MRPRIEKGYEVTEHSKYDKKTVVDTLEQWANDDAAVLIFVSGELVYRKWFMGWAKCMVELNKAFGRRRVEQALEMTMCWILQDFRRKMYALIPQ